MSIGEAALPLTRVIVGLLVGKLYWYFTSDNVADALLVAAAIPVILEPFTHKFERSTQPMDDAA